MLTLLFLLVLGCIALCLLPILLGLMLEALPLFVGLMLCWWLFNGCL